MFLYSTVSTLKPKLSLVQQVDIRKTMAEVVDRGKLTNGRDCRAIFVSITSSWAEEDLHNLSELQLVKDGGLSGSIKTNHQNSHLLLPPELIK